MATADTAEPLFDPHSVTEIDMQLPQESMDELAADPEEYVDATLAFQIGDDEHGPYAVGVRLKGGTGSFRPLTGKAAFKLKFNHSVSGQRILGLKKLTLNNMIQDRGMIQETLSYAAFRAAGVPAPRTGFAFVRVNGTAYGVYLNVETLDDVALPRFFPSTGHLYEGESGADVEPGEAELFEVDEGDEDDRADLEALIAAAGPGLGDWSERAEGLADLDEMTRMWAVEKYIGHWDSYAGTQDPLHPNNYYLHSDESGLFSMLPWGTDQTWANRRAFGGPGGVLFNACLADASCLQMYQDAVRDAADAVATIGVDEEATFLASFLAPWQAQDPRKESTAEQAAAAVQRLREFAAGRPGDVAAWLPDPPDDGEEPPPSGGGGGGGGGGEAPPAHRAAPVLVPSPVGEEPLIVKGARTSARVVTLRLGLAGGGRVRVRGTARLGGAMHTACTAKATRATAADLTLRCRLNAAARRALRKRSLALRLRTWFAPDQARPVADVRRLTVRRSAKLVARP